MVDIELVIKISEEDYEIMKHNISVNNPLCPLSQEEMVATVANGTPLFKGHGRLIDADKLLNSFELSDFNGDYDCLDTACLIVNSMPTIIESYEEQEDGI